MDLSEHKALRFEKISKETEKAFMVKFDQENVIWLPKSQIRVIEDVIYVPQWLIDDKFLEEFILPPIF